MRYVVDCREQPSENNCTLTIAGEREGCSKPLWSTPSLRMATPIRRNFARGSRARLSLSRLPLRHSWVSTRAAHL